MTVNDYFAVVITATIVICSAVAVATSQRAGPDFLDQAEWDLRLLLVGFAWAFFFSAACVAFVRGSAAA